MRVDNNLRQAYFIIDTDKAINPGNKVTETAIKAITTSFNKHGLGELNEDHLNSYYRGIKSSDNEVSNINYRPKKMIKQNKRSIKIVNSNINLIHWIVTL